MVMTVDDDDDNVDEKSHIVTMTTAVDGTDMQGGRG